jgi:hypothetical protein
MNVSATEPEAVTVPDRMSLKVKVWVSTPEAVTVPDVTSVNVCDSTTEPEAVTVPEETSMKTGAGAACGARKAGTGPSRRAIG